MTQILIYSVCIVAASYLGGAIPVLLKLSHARMQIAISFVAGFMLGVAVLHMVPHAAPSLGSLDVTMYWLLTGLLAMFLLIRAFHFHYHDIDDAPAGDAPHDHHHHADGGPHDPAFGGATWLGIAVGMAVHTLIDGIALGASVAAAHDGGGALPGVGTALAIVLHKPLDALSIVALMIAAGAPLAQQRFANLAFALLCPVAAIGFYMFAAGGNGLNETAIGAALAFAAGVFLCIALSDLLPELQFHSHDRVKLSAALLLGVALAYAITFIEPPHLHGDAGVPPHAHDHDAEPHHGDAPHSEDEHSHDDE